MIYSKKHWFLEDAERYSVPLLGSTLVAVHRAKKLRIPSIYSTDS